ncbi:MAG: HNH endonuclease signature motif containing protein [Solirubrobacteraceae bacterium]
MNGYIAHTDHGWWRSQSEIKGAEANFWRPTPRRFEALQPGEPFFFRVKSPIGKIGGFGLFSTFAVLPVWRAWDIFAAANGAATEESLREQIKRLARGAGPTPDRIGCIALGGCVFFTPGEFLDVPASFNPQNLSGSRIDLETPEGKELWSACLERAESDQETPGRLPDTAKYSRYGKPQLILPRIGQAAFRLAVLDAYAGKCAMTGESSAPAIEATHIRPWSRGGDHKRQNGLPLRRDLHRLFDLGYIAITPVRTLTVSPKLRAEFGGGDAYYALEGNELIEPTNPEHRPAQETLVWHLREIFKAE